MQTAAGIQTWIDATFGLGSGIAPLDVVNKVRIRLLDGLQPDQYVDLAVRLLVRSAWGPTSPVGTAGNAVPFGTRIAHHGAFTDSYLAPRSGTGYANGWYYGTYDAAIDNGALGDRLTLGGADLKTTTYSMFSSPTGLNGTTTLIAGQDVWWRVDTSVYSLVPGLQTAPTPAVPVRVISLIPAALTYVPGSGCSVAGSYAPTSCATRLDPASVVANSDGTTTLVWDLGMMSPTVAGVVKTVEFRTTTDVLTVSNTLAATQSYVESVNSDGSANNSTPLCSYVAAPRTNRSIPASTNGPAEVLALPTVVCDPSSLNYRLSYRSITINNAASMAVSGRVAVQQIETREKDDGTGTKVAYGVTTKNFDSVAISSTDTISVLPWVGDGRTPASSFSGSFSLQGVSTTEALSTTPNALAGPGAATPPRSGTTFYFSSLSPQLVIEDPNDASNSANSTTPWCLQSDFGAVKNCPKSMSDVTAVRVIGGSIAANGASRAFTLRFDTSGDHAGDLFTLRAVSRSPNYLLAAPTVDASIVAVESSIGDTLWEDKNGNGVIDTNEPGRFSGVRVQLLDANGKAITSTVTDAFGVYSFAGLHAGTFTVRVVDSNGADGMLDRYPTYSSSYDADNFTIGGVDGDPDGSVKLALGRGQNRADIDFGYFNATISGRAFLDANRNGIKDLNENVFAGANVSLVGVSDTGIAVVRSATTAADGTYSIPGLRPGVYSVAATSGSSFVTAIVGSSGGKASGAAASGVALSAGANATGYDFGVQGAALSGRVFTDTNGNGTLDAGEQGILKLTVTFTTPTAGGAGKPTVFSSLTDGSGMFRF